MAQGNPSIYGQQLIHPWNLKSRGYLREYLQLINHVLGNNAPGTAYNAWNQMDTPEWRWFNVYVNTDHVVHNGGIYKPSNLTNANASEPGTSYNAWNRLDVDTYQPYNTILNNMFFYKGNKVVNQQRMRTRSLAGTSQDSEGIGLSQLNDYVFYEDWTYRVVNTSNANNHVIPGTANGIESVHFLSVL